MPVFHTKTIESILEPVAVQVSKLVILHEEAEDGNAMPDLCRPIQVVKLAVDNLVKVGYETINFSDDQILKQDMPPALRRVEESSILLLQASDMLRADPYSAPARKKLIEGSRGILQGTSALLLAFDESEVRKIIRVCKNVLEYLAITEVVDRMEDLVTYVKNLSPVLTRMTKEVDTREKELTHQVHREMLIRSLEQVKNLTPVLISGIKIYITAKQTNQGVQDAQTNRDYVVRKMSDEIHEIIRVLQLTTYDEEEWDADDIAVMKKAQSAIEQKMKLAHDWLADPSALVGSSGMVIDNRVLSGDKSLRQILEDARRIADCCTNQDDRDRILKSVSNLESMSQALSELRAQGKGNSPQAMSLAREMQQKLKELQNLTGTSIANTERSGIRKPAPTVEGKVDQAQRWLTNPGLDDRGLGEQATRMVVADGRRVAEGCSGPLRSDLLRLCDETEILTNQLADLIAKGQGNSPQAKAIARHLSEKLLQLKGKIEEALVNQVAEDFIDITTPLKQLTEAASVPLGTPGREANFDDKRRNFEAHSAKLADTATMVATAGGCRNKKTVEEIFKSSKQVNDLTPQITTAAKIVFSNPENQAAVEHFELLKKQWSDNMERLRGLVDEAVDSTALVKAEEEGILRDTERVEDGIRTRDSPKIVTNASNIARRANRVLQVAQQEADNSEDPNFVDNVNRASEQLRSTITPMVQCAKVVSMNPQDPGAANNWRKTNSGLIDAVGEVRKAVDTTPDCRRAEEMFPPPPDLSELQISEPCFVAPPRYAPPPPAVPPPPAQEFPQRRVVQQAAPRAAVRDQPDGPDPIVYNSPHSTLRFYPSPDAVSEWEARKSTSKTSATKPKHQVHYKSFMIGSPKVEHIRSKNSARTNPSPSSDNEQVQLTNFAVMPLSPENVARSLANLSWSAKEKSDLPNHSDGLPIPIYHEQAGFQSNGFFQGFDMPVFDMPDMNNLMTNLTQSEHRVATISQPNVVADWSQSFSDFSNNASFSSSQMQSSHSYSANSFATDFGQNGYFKGSNGLTERIVPIEIEKNENELQEVSDVIKKYTKVSVVNPKTVSKKETKKEYSELTVTPAVTDVMKKYTKVSVVKPKTVTEEFSSVSATPPVTTNVTKKYAKVSVIPPVKNVLDLAVKETVNLATKPASKRSRFTSYSYLKFDQPKQKAKRISFSPKHYSQKSFRINSPKTTGSQTVSASVAYSGNCGARRRDRRSLLVKPLCEKYEMMIGSSGASSDEESGQIFKERSNTKIYHPMCGSYKSIKLSPVPSGTKCKTSGRSSIFIVPKYLRSRSQQKTQFVVPALRSSLSSSNTRRAPMKKQQPPVPQRSAPPPVPAPPIPPPPAWAAYSQDGPPRPPLPSDTMPPRPPPPETDDEEDFPVPQENQPIMMAAHMLHEEAKQWSSKDNEIIGAAKRMAFLMVRLSQLVRGEGGTKKDLISTAKSIAEASEEVTRLAKKLAAECTDKKMRTNLLQVCERIPTIGTQLKILSTVKATMLGAQGSEEDQEATEMLVGNAQNLMQAVKETVRAAEAASIKIRVDSGYTIRWLRKRPWYT
ncbi:vinculin-like isoform X3 [Mya arenaria]|uniref:vinculin-like isoform X3 n=1 Tax=Mya arenaria TaxID=6604 RepID=UPI0022E1ECE8|nr:vinculin-like isoform X3 [Mya arenaria]